MVFPYLKGLINKVSFHLVSGFTCIVLYFYIRSIIFWVRSTTSGIRALSWAQKWRIFFYIFAGIFGRRVCRSDLYVLVIDMQNIIVYLYSL